MDIGIKVAMGITFRDIESNLSDAGAGNGQGSGSASDWSRDYGLLIDVPVVELINKEPELMTGIAPIFDLSFGSAVTNIGKKMIYIDRA